MRYLGIDVHVKTSVWCLLDAEGELVERGKTPTTAPDLRCLVRRLSMEDELLVGQEVGRLCHFVHDTVTAMGVRILSFNAHHLRMICSSRKKTDKRDSYWIAKCLQSGMMPHPVYIPNGEVRLLRALIARRRSLVIERRRWLARARSHVLATGRKDRVTARSLPRLIESLAADPDGVDEYLAESLELCARMQNTFTLEVERVQAQLHTHARRIDAVKRLMTIPAVGEKAALTIYAWVGDVSRFPSASQLTSYAGLVPSSWQSADSQRYGGITRQGSKELRGILVQAGHVLLWRCQSADSAPLKAAAQRVHTTRARRKIAVVAAARHILRLTYYVLRDGTRYDPRLLRSATANAQQSAA
jgi:transposase